MRALVRLGVDWRDRRLVYRLCMNQSVVIRINSLQSLMHVSWAEELEKAAHCLHCCLIYTLNIWLKRPWKIWQMEWKSRDCWWKLCDLLMIRGVRLYRLQPKTISATDHIGHKTLWWVYYA